MTGAQLPDHAFALPDAELLAITGPDASTFAQAQFTNDVDALADGQWHWNGWLDAKGRLQALFGLLREDDQRLLAWLPAGGAGTLAVALSRFRFRSKVQIQPDTARTLVAVRGEASPGPGVLPLPADAQLGPRHLRLVASTVAPGDRVAVDAWHAADLRMGLPWLRPGGVASGRFVPQWLGLERLPALSLRKGCYPGQEIVARIHYLGQSRRAPALVAGAGAAPEGGWRVLDDAGRDLGELADAVADGRGGWLALAALAGGGTAPVAAVAGGEEARPAGVLDAPHAPSASDSP